tara:strand:- start:56419 stop:56655 length:237 start_codon:yes stop_codon:yes gene_type:complete
MIGTLMLVWFFLSAFLYADLLNKPLKLDKIGKSKANIALWVIFMLPMLIISIATVLIVIVMSFVIAAYDVFVVNKGNA